MNLSFLWITFAGVCWGLDGLIRSKISGVSPLTIVTIEHLFGFLMLALVSFRHLSWPKFTSRSWGVLVGVALFSGLLGTVAFTWAMAHVHYSSYGVLFLLLKLQPIFTILTALIILRERPHAAFYPLAIFGLLGSYFLSFGKAGLDFSFGEDVLRATLAGVVAALCWGSGTIFSRHLSQQGYNARIITMYRLGMVAIIGILVIGILSLMGIENSPIYRLPFTMYGLIFCVALLSGVIGTTSYYRGIKHTPAVQASIFELSLPITGFLVDIIAHQKVPDGYQIIGGIILVIAMTMIAGTSKR